MNYLTTLTDADIFPASSFDTSVPYTKRTTVKIVALDARGCIGLVTNPIHGLYLLPGGGIENTETLHQAVYRECVEELCREVEIIAEIGATKEFRARDHKEYDTHGFLASVRPKTDLTRDLRTENEKDVGLVTKWLPVDDVSEIFKEQEQKLRAGKIDFYNTGFNVVRDRMFFETAWNKHDFQQLMRSHNTQSVTALIVYNGKLLLVLRDNTPDTIYPNTWGLIGGGIEEKETPQEAMERESKEEIGITPHCIYFGTSTENKHRFFAHLTKNEAENIVLGAEGQALRFFSPQELSSLSLTPKLRFWVDHSFPQLEHLVSTKNPDPKLLSELVE